MVTSELGPLEMKVLGLLRPEEPLPVAAVRDALAKDGDDLAYTTVMTVLVRLHAKGLVVRVREGNRYLYAPAARASSVSKGILARVGQALFREQGARPILALLDEEPLSRKELLALRAAIDEKLGAGRKRS